MIQQDLELYTSEELIQELLNRTTFVGVLIRSETEAKSATGHKCFRVDGSTNLNPEQVLNILDQLVGQLKELSK